MHTKPALAIAFAVAFTTSLGFQAPATPISPDLVWAMTEIATTDVGFYPDAIAFLSNTQLAMFNRQNGQSASWDVGSGEGSSLLEALQLGRYVDVSDDLSTLAVCTREGMVSIWGVDPVEKIRDLCSLQNTPCPRGAFSPDTSLLAITDFRDEIMLWDLATGTLIAALTGHNSNVFDLAFSPDGHLLATAGGWSGSATDADSCIKIWDVAEGELIVSLPTIDIGDNHAIAFADSGARLISGGIERLIAWDTTTWQRVYDSGSSYVGNAGIAVSPNQQLLAIAYWGDIIRLVDLSTMQTCRDLRITATPVDVAFSPDGTKLAASFFDGSIIVWAVP